jgi:DNA polymerase epsilon subunit 2
MMHIGPQKSTVGLFTDNCFILVEGVYGDDHIFHVDELGLPPPESRMKTTLVADKVRV